MQIKIKLSAKESLVIPRYKTRPVALIGTGPHARRIYLEYFKQKGIQPQLVVDLESNKAELTSYINDNGLSSKVVCISSTDRDLKHLSKRVQELLEKEVIETNITHAIISTEPKAHFAYAEYFIKHNINILMDKPVTSPIGAAYNEGSAKKIYSDFLELKSLYSKSSVDNFTIQCQRRYHPGYKLVEDILKKVIAEYGVPINYIDIYHSDGSWYMPCEFTSREDHPFKYGYGKLMHSGYHFVDLLTTLMGLNDLCGSEEKRYQRIRIYSQESSPEDMLMLINKDSYAKIFTPNIAEKVFTLDSNFLKKCGEVDYFGIIQFINKNSEVITNCSLNLLKSGFTRRAWPYLPEDTYKGNGRVRHERVTVNVGPLISVQVHSYQAYEVKDTASHENGAFGDIDHFDINIFRNKEIIGGDAFQKISINDISQRQEGSLGHNEDARFGAIRSFLNNEPTQSDFLSHQDTNYLLSNLYRTLARKRKGRIPYIEVSRLKS